MRPREIFTHYGSRYPNLGWPGFHRYVSAPPVPADLLDIGLRTCRNHTIYWVSPSSRLATRPRSSDFRLRTNLLPLVYSSPLGSTGPCGLQRRSGGTNPTRRRSLRSIDPRDDVAGSLDALTSSTEVALSGLLRSGWAEAVIAGTPAL